MNVALRIKAIVDVVVNGLRLIALAVLVVYLFRAANFATQNFSALLAIERASLQKIGNEVRQWNP